MKRSYIPIAILVSGVICFLFDMFLGDHPVVVKFKRGIKITGGLLLCVLGVGVLAAMVWALGLQMLRPATLATHQGWLTLLVVLLGTSGAFLLKCGVDEVRGYRPARGPRIVMEEKKKYDSRMTWSALVIVYVLGVLLFQVGVLGLDYGTGWLYAPLGVVVLPCILLLYYGRRRTKFGVSVLDLPTCPARLGQVMRGEVRIPCRLDTEMDVKLRCVHQYTTGGGKHLKLHRDEVWSKIKRMPVSAPDYYESFVKIEFTLPAEGWAKIRTTTTRDFTPYTEPVSTAHHNRNGYWWELTLRAVLPGINYKATFEIPVVVE